MKPRLDLLHLAISISNVMVKHGGGSIRLAQKMYKKMLKEILLKSTQDLRLEQRFSFQSSNDSKHNQDNAGVASGQVWESGET